MKAASPRRRPGARSPARPLTGPPAAPAAPNYPDSVKAYVASVKKQIKTINLEQFRALYDKAVKLYASGKTGAETYFTADETAFLAANGLTDGYIRLVVSRGFGDLGLSPKNCPKPSIVCIADTIKLYPEELYTTGMRIITAPTRRISPAALPPMIKSLNYLNNIMAKMEAQQHGFHECLMLNEQGYVAECSGDNVFLIHKGRLITPASHTGALVGSTRQVALEVAAARGLTTEEAYELQLTPHLIKEKITAEQSAAAVMYLVSEPARVVTGSALMIDAGWSAV